MVESGAESILASFANSRFQKDDHSAEALLAGLLPMAAAERFGRDAREVPGVEEGAH